MSFKTITIKYKKNQKAEAITAIGNIGGNVMHHDNETEGTMLFAETTYTSVVAIPEATTEEQLVASGISKFIPKD